MNLPAQNRCLPFALALTIVPLMASLGCGEVTQPAMSSVTSALTRPQCDDFAQAKKVTICHRTASEKKPYTSNTADSFDCACKPGFTGDGVICAEPPARARAVLAMTTTAPPAQVPSNAQWWVYQYLPPNDDVPYGIDNGVAYLYNHTANEWTY